MLPMGPTGPCMLLVLGVASRRARLKEVILARFGRIKSCLERETVSSHTLSALSDCEFPALLLIPPNSVHK